MGGEGSGRPPGIKGIIAAQSQKPTLIGDSIELPNYSGIKPNSGRFRISQFIKAPFPPNPIDPVPIPPTGIDILRRFSSS